MKSSSLMAAVVALTAACLLGYRYGVREAEAQRATWWQAYAVAAESAALALSEAQERGDALTKDLAVARNRAAVLTKEKRDALQSVTTGRACLHGDAVRLLDSAPGLRASLPATAGGFVGAGAGNAASDRDLASWALAAGERYAECARRLDALIDWHDEDKK